MNHESSSHLLIDRLNEGDGSAAEQIFLAIEPSLRIVIRRGIGRRLRSKIDSGDVVQSVFADFLECVRRGGYRFDARPQVRAFLQRIAWRRLSDQARKHRTSLDRESSLDSLDAASTPVDSQPRPSEEACGRELWERALAACSPKHREVLRLRREGLKIAEIAAAVGMHEGSVRRIVYDLARRLSIARRDRLESDADVS
ncbi:MAG: sigma-70 family RNA polymerase sigma factor [Isosphaeraceae bacterium]|nr:sigma-70 family RNA polymerase sigma factor [Isosphaeraceae bacterium]